MLELGLVVKSSRHSLKIFNAKFECSMMYKAKDMVLSTLEYSVQAHLLVCLILEKLFNPLNMVEEIINDKLKCACMYMAWDMVLSMQENRVHGPSLNVCTWLSCLIL